MPNYELSPESRARPFFISLHIPFTMKNKRRDFLKFTGLAGLTAAGASVLNGFTAEPEKNNKSALDQKTHIQHFNMSG